MPYKDPERQREAERRYKASEQGRANARAYSSRPEVKARKLALSQTPEARERTRLRRQNEAYRAASRESKRRARETARRLADEYKLSRGCIDCGYSEHPAALHFDHVDPTTKSFDVARMIGTGRTWLTILAEIEKCEIRCANCHAVKTWGVR